MQIDSLDLALLTALRDNPRAGALQLSRLTTVARGTVQARLDRLERAGVITGYGPDIDLASAGYGVQAFVTLEIAQGALERVTADLRAIPGVLEAYAITGTGDLLCKVAATSHADLQATLLRIDSSPAVARSHCRRSSPAASCRCSRPVRHPPPAARRRSGSRVRINRMPSYGYVMLYIRICNLGRQS
jgi:DNA-binding Lrp family transcriptional regulator